MALLTRTGLSAGRRARAQAGFTMTEIAIALAVITIVTGFAVVRVASARDHMRLTNAARDFAAYTEKARLDSIRRHGDNDVATSPTARATVTFNANSYQVFIDHDYDGTPTTRTFNFPEGVTIANVDTTDESNTVHANQPLPLTIRFDWHGRSVNGYRITFKNSRQQEALVGITRAGEVSLDRKPITLLLGNYAAQTSGTGTVGPDGSAILSTGTTATGGGTTTGGITDGTTGGTTTGGTTTGGTTTGGTTTGGTTTGGTTTGGTTTGGTTTGNGNNGNGNNGNGNNPTPTPTPTPAPTATPTPTPAQLQCTMSMSPATTSKKPIGLHNGGTTMDSATVTITLSNAPTGAGFTVSNVPELNITVSGNTITIRAKPNEKTVNNRGNFTVSVTPSSGCGAAQTIYVSVAK